MKNNTVKANNQNLTNRDLNKASGVLSAFQGLFKLSKKLKKK